MELKSVVEARHTATDTPLVTEPIPPGVRRRRRERCKTLISPNVAAAADGDDSSWDDSSLPRVLDDFALGLGDTSRRHEDLLDSDSEEGHSHVTAEEKARRDRIRSLIFGVLSPDMVKGRVSMTGVTHVIPTVSARDFPELKLTSITHIRVITKFMNELEKVRLT